ncbi:hypothetical protein VTN77DRAFT_9353 [Rasamsonia byssochlamydoides]|uniref:uncharacterized protein n=1 Tax=Rasamsonia byssochlamydoides TaxID=89139 RepID=UPI0037432F7C
MAKSFVYDPSAPDVPLRLVTHDAPSMDGNEGQVLVKLLAAPVNRVDLMVLSGQYPVQPRYCVDEKPVPGFDGCGVVIESTSQRFQKGNLVLPRELGLGTWRTHAILPDTALMKLPRDTPPLAGALLRSGAVVAWLLLEHVAPLKSGDWIIMSAGTSCVAQFLVQFARLKGINTILVIRDRENIDTTRQKLLDLGAAAVISESELAQNAPPVPGKVVLALDCVYGSVGQNLANVLSPGGKFVLVGMLGGPRTSITVDTNHLFYKQLSFLPFRSSKFLEEMGDSKVEELFRHITRLFSDGSIKLPDLRVISWEQKEQDGLEQELRQAVKMAKSDETGYKKTVWLLS